MALQSVKNLPHQIVLTYQDFRVHADTITEVWNGINPDSGDESYEITFDDKTYDVWEWTKNPNARNPSQPNAWICTTERAPVEDEDEPEREETYAEEVAGETTLAQRYRIDSVPFDDDTELLVRQA